MISPAGRMGRIAGLRRTKMTNKTELAAMYEEAFWNALGHGMSEAQADTYASRKVAAYQNSRRSR